MSASLFDELTEKFNVSYNYRTADYIQVYSNFGGISIPLKAEELRTLSEMKFNQFLRLSWLPPKDRKRIEMELKLFLFDWAPGARSLLIDTNLYKEKLASQTEAFENYLIRINQALKLITLIIIRRRIIRNWQIYFYDQINKDKSNRFSYLVNGYFHFPER